MLVNTSDVVAALTSGSKMVRLTSLLALYEEEIIMTTVVSLFEYTVKVYVDSIKSHDVVLGLVQLVQGRPFWRLLPRYSSKRGQVKRRF